MSGFCLSQQAEEGFGCRQEQPAPVHAGRVLQPVEAVLAEMTETIETIAIEGKDTFTANAEQAQKDDKIMTGDAFRLFVPKPVEDFVKAEQTEIGN